MTTRIQDLLNLRDAVEALDAMPGTGRAYPLARGSR